MAPKVSYGETVAVGAHGAMFLYLRALQYSTVAINRLCCTAIDIVNCLVMAPCYVGAGGRS